MFVADRTRAPNRDAVLDPANPTRRDDADTYNHGKPVAIRAAYFSATVFIGASSRERGDPCGLGRSLLAKGWRRQNGPRGAPRYDERWLVGLTVVMQDQCDRNAPAHTSTVRPPSLT